MTVLDISKSGEQIGEKLFALLSEQQKHELIQYVLAKEESASSIVSKCNSSPASIFEANCRLTEIQAEGLYFCLENRIVYICETEIALTVKEFDIFALLIMNPCRVLTYDMIIDLVWHENLDYYFSHFAAELPILVTHDKDHGRTERQEYRLLPDLSWQEGLQQWKGLYSACQVTATVTKGEQTSTETRYFISSLDNLAANCICDSQPPAY